MLSNAPAWAQREPQPGAPPRSPAEYQHPWEVDAVFPSLALREAVMVLVSDSTSGRCSQVSHLCFHVYSQLSVQMLPQIVDRVMVFAS